MTHNTNPWPPKGIDHECIELCEILNTLGLETIESCCGHGQGPYRIFFKALEMQNLVPLLKVLDGTKGEIRADYCNVSKLVIFCLELVGIDEAKSYQGRLKRRVLTFIRNKKRH
jgi:hypothetical protein